MEPVITSKMMEKREKILESAQVLFAEKGYVNTPVREIIDLSGYGTGTFYKYFNNKEEVLKVLLQDFLDQIISAVREFFNREKDLYVRFIESKRVMLEVFARNQKMAEIYSRVHGISDSIDQCLQEFDNRFLAFTSRNIEYGIKRGLFRDLPVTPVASATLAIIRYAVNQWIVRKTISEPEMIDMVISFHHSLAVGIVKDHSLITQYETI
ncbi:MAG TPA: TetR/AcrR family transcriptional regulator [Syntrophomonadaceae bacterium]|nr:TetR/AcrR family transcriptional regulator [Syntrophomonadaceae bacterium]